MNEFATPVGKLLYMLWKLGKDNFISLENKNKIKGTQDKI